MPRGTGTPQALGKSLLFIGLSGAPGEIRTHDLCLRRAALYPAELRVPGRGAGSLAARGRT
jgi:hypothetical protein